MKKLDPTGFPFIGKISFFSFNYQAVSGTKQCLLKKTTWTMSACSGSRTFGKSGFFFEWKILLYP
ncbi:hypothetical protein SAMN03080598_00740 [Algoriphagus boritolerans DSM 17298 = JCM 18970]|uniref:Uncharacterized protein n=1 Tax=Algoriphagus boritolerans DSM 17298 = JCM 18970 TaxID=1120964 RepID=A0A1H5TGF2_9BACT|nr:hypothetical protein SAMN03080598_00740 [Algoriphagus boritolerans DSM 17298 = JCM 18970]